MTPGLRTEMTDCALLVTHRVGRRPSPPARSGRAAGRQADRRIADREEDAGTGPARGCADRLTLAERRGFRCNQGGKRAAGPRATSMSAHAPRGACRHGGFRLVCAGYAEGVSARAASRRRLAPPRYRPPTRTTQPRASARRLIRAWCSTRAWRSATKMPIWPTLNSTQASGSSGSSSTRARSASPTSQISRPCSLR